MGNAMGMGKGTSPACQEVTGTGPRPWVGVMPWVWVRVRVLHVKKSLVRVQDHG